MFGNSSRRTRAAVLAVALAVPLGVSTAVSAAAEPAAGGAAAGVEAATATAPDRTSAAEARRVDRVKITLDWFDCSVFTPRRTPAECASASVPLDYDQPDGATTDLAVIRVKAADPKKRIGSLFVNPGGPGGSGVGTAANATEFLPPEILERFDVVGFDPRGTNLSDNVRCWKDAGRQDKEIGPLLRIPFPSTATETTSYVQAAKVFGTACATTGKPLSASMSTVEVARDMDVLRRTLGDAKLSYLGFSYGTYLGNVYSNLFPDRVRAVVIDGNLDPVAWAGTPQTRNVPQTKRLESGEGAWKALTELLTRCGKAGPSYCSFAGKGDPVTGYAKLVAELKAHPITVETEYGTVSIDYPTLVVWLLGDLYGTDADVLVDSDLTAVWGFLFGDPAAVTAARASISARVAAVTARQEAKRAFRQKAAEVARKAGLAVDWPYDNSPEAFQSVLCTDGLNPADAARWPGYADAADRSAPGFGPLWTWASAPCATTTWTARDEDAYSGPFTRRTANPVLVVGSYWDPATNYQSSVAVSKQLPNSRLLSNDNWGHTAFGTSDCATTATTGYLVSLTLPAPGTVCVGDHQPYTESTGPTANPTARSKSVTGSGRSLPPVEPMVPGVVPMR